MSRRLAAVQERRRLLIQRRALKEAVVEVIGGQRRTPLRPWLLVIGALIMALLAFAVTRACIHTATGRSSTESR